MKIKNEAGGNSRERNAFKQLVWAIGFIFLICNQTSMSGATPVEAIEELDRPMVIGHRGYPAIAPENTLRGFELAKLAGADLVELDYHVSKDGQAIVIHDESLDRTTDAVRAWGAEKVLVSGKTIKEMKTLDAGNWFSQEYEGIRLPTLAEALDCIQADGGMTLIERKGGSAGQIVELLREKGLINQLILQSFDWAFLDEVQGMGTGQVLWALGPQKTWDGRKLSREERNLSPEWIDRVLETGSRAVVWNRSVDRASIQYAHQKGLKVIIYTINDPEEAQELIRMGVDGIISNNVSIIWKAIALLDEVR